MGGLISWNYPFKEYMIFLVWEDPPSLHTSLQGKRSKREGRKAGSMEKDKSIEGRTFSGLFFRFFALY